MDNLLIVAKICDLKKLVAVPLKYINKLDLAKALNNRINRNQTHLLFWSKDPIKEPNFNIPVSQQFNRDSDSCYNVKLLKVFGKFINSFHNVKKNISYQNSN